MGGAANIRSGHPSQPGFPGARKSENRAVSNVTIGGSVQARRFDQVVIWASGCGFVLDGPYDRSEYGSASAAGNRL